MLGKGKKIMDIGMVSRSNCHMPPKQLTYAALFSLTERQTGMGRWGIDLTVSQGRLLFQENVQLPLSILQSICCHSY